MLKMKALKCDAILALEIFSSSLLGLISHRGPRKALERSLGYAKIFPTKTNLFPQRCILHQTFLEENQLLNSFM
jgi:hypothetical protein